MSSPKGVSRRKKVHSAPARTIQSVDRTLQIIEALAESGEGRSLSELADELGLAVQTLQSLLRTLEHHQWVTQPRARGPYMLGAGLSQVYQKWCEGQNRVELARDVVEELARQTGEYVILAQWSQGALHAMLEIHPDQVLAVGREMATHETLHTMATGKVLLATMDKAERDKILDSLSFAKRGSKSVVNRGAFERQLKVVARQGTAVCVDEAGQGIVGIAVPVEVGSNVQPTAIGVSLPTVRYSKTKRDRIVEQLKIVSEKIARVWG